MRTFSSTVQTILDSNTIKYYFLIDLEFNTHYRFTSFGSDITYNGNVYTSDGGLFEVESPQFSSILDREAYRIVITDLVNEMAAEFRAGVVGKQITVRVGFLDTNGHPITNLDDVYHIYTGYADAPSIENDWDQKLAIIEGTSPMADLDSVNSFISSRDGMDQKSTTDTSFDEIFDDSEAELKWGKV